MNVRRSPLILLALLSATLLSAQTTPLRGRVADSSGATLSGADIKVYEGATVVREGKTSAAGDFEIPVPPGEYRLEIKAPDFELYTEVVRVSPDLGPLVITMQLAQVTQNVEVTTDRQELSVEADSNLNATVLGQDFIDQLPEDEDELLAALQQLAGPSAGPGGADLIIDGFSNGRIPPRSQILEVRINNNPYSTEFSRSGFGRLEIITRAGTGNFRGSFGFQFKDETLNARNAFAAEKPPFQQRNFNTNVSGPVIPGKLSLSMDARYNESDNSGTIRAITPIASISQGVLLPNTGRNIGTRGQYQLTRNNMLNFNVRYGSNTRLNQGVGGFSLLERASNNTSRQIEFQVRESAVIGERMVHEVRFSVERQRSSTNPETEAVAINVLDAFQGGGNPNSNSNNDKTYEFGNTLMYNRGKLALKTGFQGVQRSLHSLSENNYRGTFVFSSLADYIANRPITFTVTQGNPLLDMTQFESGLFLQTDWRISQRFTFSAGMRYEAQTNLSDYNNFDPRAGFALQLNQATVIRGGGGVFHQRLNTQNAQSLIRLDGTRQRDIVIRNPSFPDPFAFGDLSARPPSSIRVRAEDLAAPYSVNSSISLERQLPKGIRMSSTYEFVRGIHQFRGRNINAPLPGMFVRPDPAQGNIVQLESTGLSDEHSFRLQLNKQVNQKITVFGNYTLRFNRSDSDGAFSQPMNNYNMALDWGRSNDDTRHNFNANVLVTLPWNLRFGSRMFASSGRPYNITTGADDNGDTVTNDRPSGLGRNAGNGPGNFDMSFNITKTIQLRGGNTGNGNAGVGQPPNSFAEPQRGGGGGFPGGGFPGGGGQGGGPGGPGGGPGGRPGGIPGGGFGQPPRLQMQITADVRNALNHTNFGNYSGVMTSPFFGRPTSARNPREIQVGLRFNF